MSEKPLKSFIPTKAMKVSEFARKQIERGIPNGPYCTDVDESVPSFEIAPCEKQYPERKKGHNSYIVFGRDRTSSLASGAGGAGHTQCGMIDIVAGRFSSVQAKMNKHTGEQIDSNYKVNPNFAADAARIYITQKTLDIDEAFGFENNSIPSKFHSAIAIKSDHTRIIGRELVRIYAGLGKFEIDDGGETAANGDKITPNTGIIQIIGGRGNEEALQPAVLGNKLVEYLTNQSEIIAQIYNDLFLLNEQLSKINGALTGVPGVGGLFAKAVGENVEQMTQKIRKGMITKLDNAYYLDSAPIAGGGSFLSTSVFIT